MRSIFDPHERERLHRRLARLTPDAPPRWGRMTAPEMVCHLTDALGSAFAPSPTPGTGLLARFPLRPLVLSVLPWPKGRLQSPPDLLVTRPTTWADDLAALHAALARVSARDPQGVWPASEVFGALTGAEWGTLLRTHLDHHLRQFGV